jgi:hypothetical protein
MPDTNDIASKKTACSTAQEPKVDYGTLTCIHLTFSPRVRACYDIIPESRFAVGPYDNELVFVIAQAVTAYCGRFAVSR